MADTNLVSIGKVIAPSIPSRRRTDKSELHMQLRNEIDKLAIFIRDLKAHADRVQRAADALGGHPGVLPWRQGSRRPRRTALEKEENVALNTVPASHQETGG